MLNKHAAKHYPKNTWLLWKEVGNSHLISIAKKFLVSLSPWQLEINKLSFVDAAAACYLLSLHWHLRNCQNRLYVVRLISQIKFTLKRYWQIQIFKISFLIHRAIYIYYASKLRLYDACLKQKINKIEIEWKNEIFCNFFFSYHVITLLS